MEWWAKMMFPMERVWKRVAARLGFRSKSGILKLHNDVMTCEYKDVQVMWEMLKKNEFELSRSPIKSKKRVFWNILDPYLCRSF